MNESSKLGIGAILSILAVGVVIGVLIMMILPALGYKITKVQIGPVEAQMPTEVEAQTNQKPAQETQPQQPQVQPTKPPVQPQQGQVQPQQPTKLPYCFGKCWTYDDVARTMTWDRSADGSEDVWEPSGEPLDKIRGGYTAVFTSTIPGEIFACEMVINDEVIQGCGLHQVSSGTYHITSSGAIGGFRWCPALGSGWRKDGGDCK